MTSVSVCMATYNRPRMLSKTLESVFRVPFSLLTEVIVVDDGSDDAEAVSSVCRRFPLRLIRIVRGPGSRNPALARNLTYTMARGEVLVMQSDDVVWHTPDASSKLASSLAPGTIAFARVYCLGPNGVVCGEYCGRERRVPFFFLGAAWKRDVYAVGGNDEEFMRGHACEDQWFADCLTNGQGMRPVYLDDPIGHHQWHPVSGNTRGEIVNRRLLRQKQADASAGKIPWASSSGPWSCDMTDMRETFERVYRENLFSGDEETRCGYGSKMETTERLRAELPELFRRHGIRTLADVACGDLNWMQHVAPSLDVFMGSDVVQSVIDENRRRFPQWEFFQMDLTAAIPPTVDCLLCRDCLVHLSYEDARRAVANIKASGSTFLLATTFPDKPSNVDIQTGLWTSYNMQAEPFNFPVMLDVINEGCTESYPLYTDKSLGLWRIEDLPELT